MPYGPFDSALSSLTPADLDRLVRDGRPEGEQLDYKEDLSETAGGASAWRRGERTISDRARRVLARMVVGFANAEGGTVIVGVRETADRPARPDAIVPLPAVAELAERVRRALLDLIDPRPDRLEVVGVPTEGEAGVLVLRTPPSLSAPHRVAVKDGFGIYVRRGDQTVEATMREVHDIVLRRESGAERFERTFREARSMFEARMAELRAGASDPARSNGPVNSRIADLTFWAVGWSVSVAPIPRATVEFAEVGQFSGGGIYANEKAWAEQSRENRLHRAVRILGGRTDTGQEERGNGWREVGATWFRDGRGWFSCAVFHAKTNAVADIRPEWLAVPLLDALIWVRAVREHSGDPGLGFGLQVCVDNRDGARMASAWSGDRSPRVVPAVAASAIYEVGPPGAMGRTVDAVMRDAGGAFGNELRDRQFTLRWDDDAEA